jgi:hypothetical protein
LSSLRAFKSIFVEVKVQVVERMGFEIGKMEEIEAVLWFRVEEEKNQLKRIE